MASEMTKVALLLGGSGETGKQVLKELNANPMVSRYQGYNNLKFLSHWQKVRKVEPLSVASLSGLGPMLENLFCP